MLRPQRLLAVVLLFLATPALKSEENKKTVEQVVEAARKSVVVITSPGRDGKGQRLGAGFVVGDGLIATNLHVIGEARPIKVQLADGTRHDVTGVHAFDRGPGPGCDSHRRQGADATGIGRLGQTQAGRTGHRSRQSARADTQRCGRYRLRGPGC